MFGRNRSDASFAKRPELDEESWYQRYYAPLGVSFDAAMGVAKLLSTMTGAAETKILPEDCLEEKEPLWLDDEGLYLFEGLLIDKLIPKDYVERAYASGSRFYTVGDWVRLYSNVLKSRGKTPPADDATGK